MCEDMEVPPIEGFELDVEAKLRRRQRATHDHTDDERWKAIYGLLFPGEDVPSPCKSISTLAFSS
jgi:hypothetical protein